MKIKRDADISKQSDPVGVWMAVTLQPLQPHPAFESPNSVPYGTCGAQLCCFILTVSVAYSHPSAIYPPISESWQAVHDEHIESPTQGNPPFCSVSF